MCTSESRAPCGGHAHLQTAMDAVAAISRFTLIGAALLVAFIGYREWSRSREGEERRHEYTARGAESRRRPPPQPADDCPICLEPYHSPIEILPCGHVFHKRCIRFWFNQRLICPVCKGSLNKEDRDEYRRRLRN